MTLPKGWKQEPLAKLAYYHNGRAFKPSDWESKGLPIIRIAQITNPDAETDFYSGNDVEKRHLIDDNDLIFSWSATLAVMKWNRGPAILNQHIFKVEEKPEISRDFLLYCLQNSMDSLAGHSHGSTMKHIKKSALDHHSVLVPPLPEQEKIAEILGSVDAAIEATQHVIDQTAKTKKALMTELLTRGLPNRHTRFKPSPFGEIPENWSLLTLGEISENLQTGPFGSLLKASEYTSDGVPVIMPKDIDDFRIIDTNTARIPEATAERLKKYRVISRDLLFSRRGDLSCYALVRSHEEGWLCGTGCLIARLKTSVFPEYVITYFSQAVVVQWLENNAVGQTMKNLNTKILSGLPIALPDYNEQKKIAEILLSFDKRLRIEQKKQDQLKSLKSALMQVLLTGKVRVPIYNHTEHGQDKEVVNG